jgi:hypothetical protein
LSNGIKATNDNTDSTVVGVSTTNVRKSIIQSLNNHTTAKHFLEKLTYPHKQLCDHLAIKAINNTSMTWEKRIEILLMKGRVNFALQNEPHTPNNENKNLFPKCSLHARSKESAKRCNE